MTNMIDYVKNVAKSVAYSAADELSETAESSKAFITTNKEIMSEVYTSMKDLRKLTKRITGYIKKSKVYEAADEGVKSVLEDIKTGKFYNKERIAKFEERALGSTMDFGDEDEFGFSGFDDDTSSNEGMADDGDLSGFDDVEEAVVMSSRDNAAAISTTVAKVGASSIAASKANTLMLYDQQIKANSIMEKGFTSIFDRIGEVNKVNFELASTHADNAAKFFESTTSILQEQNSLLQQIVENQKASMGAVAEEKKSSTRITYRDVIGSNGELNIRSYLKNIKQNIGDAMPSELRMLFGNTIGGENSNLLLTYASSPLRVITDFVAKSLIPGITKKAVQDLDNTISGSFSGLLANFNRMQNSNEDNEFKKWVGKIFGVRNVRTETPDPKDYNKGQMPWNGIAQKSITEVIPGYLRRIEALLSGEGERIYKWSTGKWSTARDFREEYDRSENAEIKSAYRDVQSQMTNLLKKSAFFTDDQWKDLNENMERFLKHIIVTDYGNPRFTKDSAKKYWDYGISNEETMQLLIDAFMNTQRSERAQLSRNAFQAKDRQAERLNSLFKDNMEMIELFNNSRPNYGYTWDKNQNKFTRIPGLVHNNAIDKILDDKGHNIFFYLQKMYQEMAWFREAGYGTGASVSTTTSHANRPVALNVSYNPPPVAPRSRVIYSRNYRAPEPPPLFRDLSAIFPDDNEERKRKEREAEAKEERNKKMADEARDKGIIIFNPYDDSSRIALSANMKKLHDKYYGDGSIDSFIESDETKSYLAANGTWVNADSRDARRRRREIIADIDKRIAEKTKSELKGDSVADNEAEKKYGFFDRIHEAETAAEKFAIFTNSLDNVVNAPSKLLTNIILKADERIYGLVFGDEKPHYINGKPVKSVLEEITFQIKGTFEKLNTWIDNKIIKPFQEKGIHTIGDFFQHIGEMFNLDLKGSWQKIKNGVKKGAKNAVDSVKEAAGAARDFVFSSNDQTVQNIANKSSGENTYNKIKSRHEKIHENLSSITDIQRLLSQFGEINGLDVTNIKNLNVSDQANIIKQLSDYMYGEYKHTENIDDVDKEFIKTYLNNINDDRLKGKSLFKLSQELSHKDYKILKQQLIQAYNDKIKEDTDKNRDNLFGAYSAAVGVNPDSVSKFLKKIYDDKLSTSGIVGSLLLSDPFTRDDFFVDYTSPFMMAGKLSGTQDAKNFIRRKNVISNIMSQLDNITSGFNKSDKLPKDIQEYLDANEGVTTEDLQKLVNDKLDELSNFSAENIINIFKQQTGEDVDTLFSAEDGELNLNENKINNINLLLSLINKRVKEDNSSKGRKYNGALVNLFKGAIDSGALTSDMIENLGIKLIYNKRGALSAIANSSDELSDISQNVLKGLVELQNAKGARYITKTGLTTIHEGEMVIPSELNPYNPNRGKVSKSTEIANENRVKNKFLSGLSRIIGRHSKGTTSYGMGTAPLSGTAAQSIDFDPENYKKFKTEDGKMVYRFRSKNDENIWIEVTLTEKEMADNNLSMDPNFPDVPPSGVGTQRKIREDGSAVIETAQEKIKKGVGLVLKNSGMEEGYNKASDAIKKYGAAGLGGGLLGGGIGLGLSALTGMAGGPIVGAIVGAVGNIARKSETVSNFLFGEVINEEDGTRAGGLISSDVQGAFKKYAPSMTKFGLGGALAGLITPFGPIGGALIGSTIGFMRKNDDFQGLIFGEDGIFSLEDKEKFKKALPTMGLGAGIGALTGLIGGPFGILGGAAVGAAGGFISTTDQFKDLLLGKEYDTGKKDKDGNPIMERTGGVLGAVKKITVDPLKNGADYLKENLKSFIENDIINPLKDGVKPLAHMLKNGIKSLTTTISNAINTVFETKLGVPIQAWLQDRVLKPATKFMGNIVKLPFKLAGDVISAPFKVFGWMGNNIRANQIKRGTDLGSTAAERLAWRDKHKIRSKKIFGSGMFTKEGFIKNDGYRTVDENLANMSDTDIEALYKNIVALQSFEEGSDKLLTNTTKEIKDLIATRFETGNILDGPARVIFRELKEATTRGDGNYDRVYKAISNLKSRDGKPLSTEEANALIGNLSEVLHKYDAIKAGKKLTSEEAEETRKKLVELGFVRDKLDLHKDGFLKGLPRVFTHEGTGEFNLDKISGMLSSEKKGREKDGTWMLLENTEKQLDTQSETSKFVKDISDTVSKMLDILSHGNTAALINGDYKDSTESSTKKERVIRSKLAENEIKNYGGAGVRQEKNTERMKSKVSHLVNKVGYDVDENISESMSENDIIDKFQHQGFYKSELLSMAEEVDLEDGFVRQTLEMMSKLRKNKYKIPKDAVSEICNAPAEKGWNGRGHVRERCIEFINVVHEINADIVKKLAKISKNHYNNIQQVYALIQKNNAGYIFNTTTRRALLDPKSFDIIKNEKSNNLRSVINYISKHKTYADNYTLIDALTGKVPIYTENRQTKIDDTNETIAAAATTENQLRENISNLVAGETEVVNAAFGRFGGGTETAVVSKGELIVDPDDIKTYAKGKKPKKIKAGQYQRITELPTNDLITKLTRENIVSGKYDDVLDGVVAKDELTDSNETKLANEIKRLNAIEMDRVLMAETIDNNGKIATYNADGKKLGKKEHKGIATVLNNYLDINKKLEALGNGESLNKESDEYKEFLKKQTELQDEQNARLKSIATYLGFDVTNDGDVLRKLINKKGEVYVNKHDHFNKKALAEGNNDNENNENLKGIRALMGKVHYGLFEKQLGKEGQYNGVLGVLGNIAGKVLKYGLGSLLIGGVSTALIKKLFGEKGEKTLDTIGDTIKNKVFPTIGEKVSKIAPVVKSGLSTVLTDILPNAIGTAGNWILDTGGDIGNWIINNGAAIGNSLTDFALGTFKTVSQIAPDLITGIDQGIANATGMKGTGNRLNWKTYLGAKGLRRVLTGNPIRPTNWRLPGFGGAVISKATNGYTKAANAVETRTVNLINRARAGNSFGHIDLDVLPEKPIKPVYNTSIKKEVDKLISEAKKNGKRLPRSNAEQTIKKQRAIAQQEYEEAMSLYEAVVERSAKSNASKTVFNNNVDMLTKNIAKETGQNVDDVLANGIERSMATATRKQQNRIIKSSIRNVTGNADEAAEFLTKSMKAVSKSKVGGILAANFANLSRTLRSNAYKHEFGEIVGDAAAEEITKKLADTPLVKKSIGTLLSEAGSNIAESVAAKATRVTPIGIVFSLSDLLLPVFSVGDAKEILGITVKPTWGQRIVAGVGNMLWNLIPGLSLIPLFMVVNWLLDPDRGIFKDCDFMGIVTAKKKSNALVNAFNAETGLNLTTDEYDRYINGTLSSGGVVNEVLGVAFGDSGKDVKADYKRTIKELYLNKGIEYNEKTWDNLVEKYKGATGKEDGTVIFQDGTSSKDQVEALKTTNSELAVQTEAASSSVGLLSSIDSKLSSIIDYFNEAEETDYSAYVSANNEIYTDYTKLVNAGLSQSDIDSILTQKYGYSYGSGSGRYSQRDTSINMRYNKPGDSIYQDINSSGCGPIAATNLINRHIKSGMGLIEPSEAASYALKHGYKETNGGTDPRYFKDYFKINGIESNITSDKSEMRKAIRNGQQVILMGKNSKYGAGTTPYGPNPHYVVATGVNGSDIIIDNPEEFNEYTAYDANDTIKQSSKAIITNSKFGMGTSTIVNGYKVHYGDLYDTSSTNTSVINNDATELGKTKDSIKNEISSRYSNLESNLDQVSKTFDDNTIINRHIPINKASLETLLTPGGKIAKLDNFDSKTAAEDFDTFDNYLTTFMSKFYKGMVYSYRDLLQYQQGYLDPGDKKTKYNVLDETKRILNVYAGEENKYKYAEFINNLISLFEGRKISFLDSTTEDAKTYNKSTHLHNLHNAMNSIDNYYLHYGTGENGDREWKNVNINEQIPGFIMQATNLMSTTEDYKKVNIAAKSMFGVLTTLARNNMLIKAYDDVLQAMKKSDITPDEQARLDNFFTITPEMARSSLDVEPMGGSGYYDLNDNNIKTMLIGGGLYRYNIDQRNAKPIKKLIYNPKILPFFSLIDLMNNRELITANSFENGNYKDGSETYQNMYNTDDLSVRGMVDSLRLDKTTIGNALNNAISRVYAEASTDNIPKYVYPTLISETYKELIKSNRDKLIEEELDSTLSSISYDSYNSNKANIPSSIKAFLQKYKRKYNPSSDNSIPSYNEYSGNFNDKADVIANFKPELKNNLIYSLLKAIKGFNIDEHAAVKDAVSAENYYNKHRTESVSSLSGALNIWSKDVANFEDFIESTSPYDRIIIRALFDNNYKDSNKLDDSIFRGIESLDGATLAERMYNILHDGARNSIALGESAKENAFKNRYLDDNIINRNELTPEINAIIKAISPAGNSHIFTHTDRVYLHDLKKRLYNSKLTGPDYKNENGEYLTLREALKRDVNKADTNLNVFRNFDKALQSIGIIDIENSNINPIAERHLNTPDSLDSPIGGGSTATVRSILQELDNTIGIMSSEADTKLGLSYTASARTNALDNGLTQFDLENGNPFSDGNLFNKDLDVRRRQLMLQILMGNRPQDTPVVWASSNGINDASIKAAFASMGPLPYSLFSNLYLSDPSDERVNNYFTSKYISDAINNYSDNALKVYKKLKDHNAQQSEMNEIKKNPNALFDKYLKFYTPIYDDETELQMQNETRNLWDFVDGNNINQTNVFTPLTKYLSDFNLNYQLSFLTKQSDAQLLELLNKGGKLTDDSKSGLIPNISSDSISDTGKIISATGVTGFSSVAFEDLSRFSKIDADEINRHIENVYRLRGIKRYKPFARKGSLFVQLANTYKVNPRFVLAVLQIECGFCGDSDVPPTKDNENAYYHDKYKNYQSLMDGGHSENSYKTMHDFTKSSYNIKGVELEKCDGDKAFETAIKNVFRFFSEVSFKQRNQKTAFSLNFKEGYVYCGTSVWLATVCQIMESFSKNTDVHYIYPTSQELRYFKSVEGKDFDESTLPEEPSALSKLKSGLLKIIEGIWGSKILELVGLKENKSRRMSNYVGGFSDARDFFAAGGLTDESENPSFTQVTSNFGPRELTIDGKPLNQHMGIDMTSRAGEKTNIYSPISGTVAMSGDTGDGYGNKAVILDNGDELGLGAHYHLFGHMSKNTLKTGDKISAGDFIGKMGTTGKSTGVHLHYGVAVPKTNGSLDIGNRYYESEMPASGVPNDGMDWSDVPNEFISSDHGWIDPDSYINNYMDNMSSSDIDISSGEGSGKDLVAKATNNQKSNKNYQPAMGMGNSGKKSATEVLLTEGLKKIEKNKVSSNYQPAMGMGGSDKHLHLDTRAKNIVRNRLNEGKGGASDNNSELQTLKEISSILTSINENTAKSNLFLAAFLKAVQNGEISANSPMFTNIINALSGSKNNGTLDDSTSALINTMTNIARQ